MPATENMTPVEALAEALRKQRYRVSATWETSAAQVIDQLRARGFDITPAWRSDMENAPRDGTWLLLFNKDIDCFIAAPWDETGYGSDPGWCALDIGYAPEWPTHWQPIDPPPSDTG